MNPALLAAIPVMLWSLDDGPSGFVESGDSLQWEWGVPTSGPGGTDAVWATRLNADYLNDASDQLEVPLPSLMGIAYPVLAVRHWYDIRSGDFGRFEVNAGAGWVPIDPIFGYPSQGTGFTGTSVGWVETSLDLSGLGTSPKVRFAFASNATVSASGWYVSDVGLYDGDITAPSILPLSLPSDTEVVTQGYPVQLEVQDDTTISTVTLSWRVNLGAEQAVGMVDLGAGLFQGEIPAQSPDSVVTWYAVADDGSQTSQFPDIGSESFRVFLAAPSELAPTATGRIIGNRVELGWTEPASIHSVVSYRIEAVDAANEGPWVVFDTVGEIPLVPDGARSFQVRAVYDVGIGDPSNQVDVSAEVPDLVSIWPPAGWQGDTVRVQLRGSDLYLTQQTASTGFGSGIRVEQVEVVDVDRAIALISISADAEPGPRDVLLSAGWGTVSFPDAFTVLDGADAPRIVDVTPSSLVQGDAATVRVTASRPFGPTVAVEVDEGLLLVQDPIVVADVATLELVVAGDAPAGPHTLVLDDGGRLWTVDLEVEERVYRGESGCGGCNAGSFGPGFAPWLLVLALLRTRRDQARRLHPALSRRSRRNGRSVAE